MKKASFFTILLTVFVDLLGVGIVIPIIAPLFIEPASPFFAASTPFQSRALYMGALIALYPLAQFFSSPLLGAISDKYGRKPVLFFSLAGTALGYAVQVLGIIYGSLALITLGRVLDGATGGNITVAQSAIADLSDDKSKAKNFGMMGAVFGLGFITGPLIGAVLLTLFPGKYFTPYLFALVLSSANLLLVVKVFKETLFTRISVPITITAGVRNIVKAFSLRELRSLFVVSFLISFGFSFFTQFIQVYLLESLKVTESAVGYMFSLVGVFIVITQGGLLRPLTARFSSRKIILFSMPLFALSVFAVTFAPAFYLVVLFIPFLAIGSGLTNPNVLAIISNHASKETQGEVLGINQSLSSLSQVFPPIISGVMAGFSVRAPLITSGVCLVIAYFIFAAFVPEKRKEREFNL